MFRYRAIRKNSYQDNRWYLFKLKDCPALLWEDTFFLAGKAITPIMRYDTIVRGHPTLNIFEGDIICDKGSNEELGIVVFNNGFFMQKNNSSIKKPIPQGHIYVSKGDTKSIEILKSFERTPIKFKYHNMEFDFSDLVKVEGDALTIMLAGKTQSVHLNSVAELLYVDRAKKYRGYKGDIVNGVFINVDNINFIGE